MTKRKRLKTIQTLAESAETTRSRVVSDQRLALREEESRLAQLEQYCGEYQTMSSRPEAGVSIHLVRGRRGFVQKLNEAIDNQRQVVVRANEQLDTYVAHWRDARAMRRRCRCKNLPSGWRPRKIVATHAGSRLNLTISGAW